MKTEEVFVKGLDWQLMNFTRVGLGRGITWWGMEMGVKGMQTQLVVSPLFPSPMFHMQEREGLVGKCGEHYETLTELLCK